MKDSNINKSDIFDRIMKLPCFNFFEPFYKKNKSVLLYLFFGGLTTLVSILSFMWANLYINELIANIISWVFAVTFAYITNRIWVFNSKSRGKEIFYEMSSFFMGRFASLGIEEIILLIFVTWLKFNSVIIKITSQFVVLILNYFISKIWVFNDKRRKNEQY